MARLWNYEQLIQQILNMIIWQKLKGLLNGQNCITSKSSSFDSLGEALRADLLLEILGKSLFGVIIGYGNTPQDSLF